MSYYVTAKVRKICRTAGGPVGPEHAGKTFVPYDDRAMSLECARESAANSNDRYRPHIHGFTYVAVHAEPVSGTNRVRNLDRT